jgi:hypothetical protein
MYDMAYRHTFLGHLRYLPDYDNLRSIHGMMPEILVLDGRNLNCHPPTGRNSARTHRGAIHARTVPSTLPNRGLERGVLAVPYRRQ